MRNAPRKLIRFAPQDITILAIDPGANLGVSIAKLDVVNDELYVLDSHTLKVDSLVNTASEVLRHTCTKQEIIENKLIKYLHTLYEQYHISHVIYEAAYNSRSLIAYNYLMFYGNVITKSCRSYSFEMSYESVSPSLVKKHIGVKGNNGDKQAIRDAVRSSSVITIDRDINFESLTEHAVDSIAIAHYCYINYRSYFIGNEL